MTHEPFEQPRGSEPDQRSASTGATPSDSDAGSYSAPPETRSPWAHPTTPYAGHPYGSSPYAGQSYAGQSSGQQPYPGQPYPGQPYPGQPYAGQQPFDQSAGYQPWVGQPSAHQPHGGTYGNQPYGGYAGYPGYYGQPYGAGTQERRPNKARKGVLLGLLGLVVAAALVLAGVGFATSGSNSIAGSGRAAQFPQVLGPNGSGNGGAGSGPSGNGGSLPNGGSTPSGSTTAANATQKIGVVTVVSTLTYQQAESAGTGMILSSNGLILTNNHVVNGATSITVTVESTNRSYKADVVGTAPTKDIAVLKLRNASGLSTAAFAGSASGVRVGDAVTGVGNAGGTGTLTAASGKVVALNQSITATDENGQEAETLHGLIEVNAPIISGDSGGPLYDAKGQIVGIDTAASSSSRNQNSGASTAYAITIDNAMSVAKQIESGVRTTTIHIGLPGFLGVSTAQASGAQAASGVAVQSVVQGGPADRAGITQGSTITSVNGRSVGTPTALRSILSAKQPGTKVDIGWTDPGGGSHTSTVTLTTGPAD